MERKFPARAVLRGSHEDCLPVQCDMTNKQVYFCGYSRQRGFKAFFTFLCGNQSRQAVERIRPFVRLGDFRKAESGPPLWTGLPMSCPGRREDLTCKSSHEC
jgi:hypothetical protein